MFVPIQGTDGRYLINAKGEVYSIIRGGRILKQYKDREHYSSVTLMVNGTKKCYSVNKLIRLYFGGANNG